MSGPNVYSPAVEESSYGPFRQRRARVGREAGAERLGASLYEIAPGEAPFPFHVHAANEEIAVVLAGTPSLRAPGGWRELAEGELVSFPRGERGAHQIANFSAAAPARVLIVSEMRAPEINRQPDSGKLGAFEDPPGTPDGRSRWFHPGSAVDYWEGEEPPAGPE